MAMQSSALHSNPSHVTTGHFPVANPPVSSSWEIMDQPVPISNTNSDLSGENGTNLTTEPNRASYITSLQNRGDLMAAIASEFERHAQMSSSQRASSWGTSSQNSQHSSHQNLSNETASLHLNTNDATHAVEIPELVPGGNHSRDPNDQTSHENRTVHLHPEHLASLRLENAEVPSGAPSNTQMSDDRIHPQDDHIAPSNVRQNRTSQLRHTIASQNRQTHVSSVSERRQTETVNRNHSSVSEGHVHRERSSQRGHREHSEDTASNRFYNGFQQNTYPTPPPIATYENDLHQKSLLDLMTRGFRTFTTEMADVIIDKLKPENESFARHVGKEVKEATDKELQQLREKLEQAEARIKELESQNVELKDSLAKERDQSKKEVEKEVLKRAKVYQEQSAIITKLEGDLHKVQTAQKEKDKLWRKAEVKAKAEEQKRIKLEEEYAAKVKEMQKQLDKMKGDLLVQKSVRRLQTKENLGRVNSGRLISHHGGYKKHMIHPKHVPYDEGDP